MTRWSLLALACWIGFVPSSRAAESVLYAVLTSEEHSGTSVSETQGFGNEIFAVDPETGKQRLVFSDVNAPFFLMLGDIVAVGGRVFADGVDRKQLEGLTPGSFLGPETLYELSTDGSGQARKVFDLGTDRQRVDFHNLFFNSSGSQFGYIAFRDGQFYLFVHDTETGKVLRKSQLRGWNFGSPENIGRMPDDKRIFFTEEVPGSGADALWTTPGSPVGTYVLDENATKAERLAPEAELHPKIEGMEPCNDSPAFLIGTLPDGRLLLHDCQRGPAGDTVSLYELDLARKTQQILPFQVEGDPAAFHLSRSGDRLTFAGTQKRNVKQFEVAVISSVWVMELKSGQQRRLLSFLPGDETRSLVGPWINLIGWLDK
jgi:hypothetical protein